VRARAKKEETWETLSLEVGINGPPQDAKNCGGVIGPEAKKGDSLKLTRFKGSFSNVICGVRKIFGVEV